MVHSENRVIADGQLGNYPLVSGELSGFSLGNVSAVSEGRRWNSLELRGNADGALSIQPFERSRGTRLA